MRLDCTVQKHAQIVRPYGVLGGADAEQFERQVRDSLQSSGRNLIIDISHLAFVDSQGLEALVGLAEHQIRNGRTTKLAGSQPVVQEVLELTELAPLFESYSDVTAAVEACR